MQIVHIYEQTIPRRLELNPFEIAKAVLSRANGSHRTFKEDIRQPDYFEKEIEALEAKVEELPIDMRGTIFFFGSSLFRFYPGLEGTPFPLGTAVNLGFGGSHYHHLAHNAERFAKYHPGTMVLTAGSNDIAFGKSPEFVVKDCSRTIRTIKLVSPQTRIFVMLILPTPRRARLWDKMQEANRGIFDQAQDEGAKVIDLVDSFLGQDQQFQKDRLHLNLSGYGSLDYSLRNYHLVR